MDHTAPCLGYSFIEKDKRRIVMGYVAKFGLKKHPLLGVLQKGKSIMYNGKKVDVKLATSVVKGKKVVFIVDTGYFAALAKFAKGAEVLVCESTLADELAEKAKPFIGLGVGIFVFILVISIIAFIFWLLMLIHAIKHNSPDRSTWILVLVVSFVVGLSFIGAIAYFFAEKKNAEQATAPSKPESSSPPQKVE